MKNQATDLHARSVVIVMHDHRPIAADIPMMLMGGVTAKVFNLLADVDIKEEYSATAYEYDGWAKKALVAMDNAYREIEADSRIILALSAGDIERAKGEGNVAILFGSEGGKLLEGNLGLLRMFYRLGLRELQLTWAFPNQLANERGLTDFGREVVEEANRLGIVIDLTHIGERAFYEVLQLTQNPVIVSHCAARAVTTDLSDERIRAIAENGGVLGIHFYSTYMAKRTADRGYSEIITVSDLLDHIDYIANLVGIDHVGLGVDFFPTEGPWAEFQKAQGTQNIRWVITDMSEMPKVTEEFIIRGYSEDDIQKVLGLNFLKVCRQVFGG